MTGNRSSRTSGIRQKKYEELTITDDFMFCKIMTTHPRLCKHLLEMILKVTIREIRFLEAQKTIDLTADSKSVRLDVYVDDEKGTVYNIEMQTSANVNLPKRSRYYQGMIDLNLLEKGVDYRYLPKSFVIFICTFDPFGKQLPIYTFSNRCHESDGLELGDETQKVFLNPQCNRDGLSKDLAAFMDYLLGQLSDDTYVQDLDGAVKDARQHKEWRREYMTLEMKYQEKYLEGKIEGKVEEIVFDGIEDQLPKEKILQRIMKRVDVDESQALEYYEFFRKQV